MTIIHTIENLTFRQLDNITDSLEMDNHVIGYEVVKTDDNEYKVIYTNTHEKNALLYAEKYGIIEYTLKRNIMTWYESFPSEGHYKHQLNLVTNNHLSIKLQRKPKKRSQN